MRTIIKRGLINFLVPSKFHYLFSPTITPLGRWSNDDDDKIKNIRATLANHDCCGDKLCGDPIVLKDNIKKIRNDK